MSCKGICVRYKNPRDPKKGIYASGARRCQICEIFIKWEGIWCPCCGYRIRTKPRNRKWKNKLAKREDVNSHTNRKVMHVSESGEITLTDV